MALVLAVILMHSLQLHGSLLWQTDTHYRFSVYQSGIYTLLAIAEAIAIVAPQALALKIMSHVFHSHVGSTI